jgi:hypothetical protein
MINHWSKQAAIVATFALVTLASLLAWPQGLRAQDTSAMPQAAQQAASALTGGQQSAANSALCSALGQLPGGASAGPSALSNPGVMSTAAATFAGSTSLPLSSATSMLQGYVAQHATDIMASCAVSNATSGITSKLPANMPSMPSIP